MRQFSAPHVAALAVMVAAVAGSVLAARRHPGRWVSVLTYGLATVILAGWAGEYVADALDGTWSIRFTLPLQLTDLISLTAVLALTARRLWLVELLYYWSLTATLQAVLTPDLQTTFPHLLYFTYFAYHIGAIVAALFLVYGLRLYPRPGAVWRTFAATLVWAAVAGTADALTGSNYMYLAWKPSHSSLLSVLGPWPLYIAAAATVGLLMMMVVAMITNRIVSITP